MIYRSLLPLCAMAALPGADLGSPTGIAEQLQATYLDEREAALKAIDDLSAAEQEELVPLVLPILRIDNWDNRIRLGAQALREIGLEASGQLPTLIDRLWNCAAADRSHLSSYYIDAIVGIATADIDDRDDRRAQERGLRGLLDLMLQHRQAGDRAGYDRLAAALTAKGAEAADDLIALYQDSDADLRPLVLRALRGLGPDAAAAVPVLMARAPEADAAERERLQQTLDLIKADNSPPTGSAVTTTCTEGRHCELSLPVSDSDDVLLRASIAQEPAQGSIERLGPTRFRYHAAPGHTGPVTISWVADDGTATSQPQSATVTVQPDTRPPAISAIIGTGSDHIRVVFNEPVAASSAADPSRYSLDQGVTVSGAELQDDGQTVLLTVAEDLTPDQHYQLQISDLSDASARGNSADLEQSFLYRDVVPGLLCRRYQADDKELEDHSSLPEPIDQLSVDSVTDEHRPRKKNYGLEFVGKIRIAEAGTYTFSLESDDGSFLWIDQDLEIDNGGFHGKERESSTVDLEPGLHNIRIYFFQGGGGQHLELSWQPPGASKRSSIPAELWFHQPQ